MWEYCNLFVNVFFVFSNYFHNCSQISIIVRLFLLLVDYILVCLGCALSFRPLNSKSEDLNFFFPTQRGKLIAIGVSSICKLLPILDILGVPAEERLSFIESQIDNVKVILNS